MAEALGKRFGSDAYGFHSAGTATKPRINRDAVRLIKELYGIDMEATPHSKTIDEIPEADIVITVGCTVQYPSSPPSIPKTGIWKTLQEKAMRRSSR
jgi:arsenate reductase